MCDRNGVALASLLVLTASLPLTAQRADPDSALRARIASLTARADTLAGRWRALQVVAVAVHGAGHDELPDRLDTLSIGALRIVTNPSPLPVRQAMGPAWAILDSLFGSALDASALHPLLLQATDPDTAVPQPIHPWGLTVTWTVDSATLVPTLVAASRLPQPDSSLRDWLGGGVRPTFRAREESEAVYTDLITAPYLVVRQCFRGLVADCAPALGLGSPIERASAWYTTPEERRSVVAHFEPYLDDAARHPMFRACADGNDSACVALLREMEPTQLPKVLSQQARETLVRLALVLGGRGAYLRLATAPAAPMGERLVAAAGIPLDSLLARWRSAILAARPVPLSLSVGMILVAAGWGGLFGFLGLMSSRWRFN